MKIRILYPTVTQSHGVVGEGGDVAEVDDALGKALCIDGSAEEVEPKVERATKAPGEKRPVRVPREPRRS